MPTPTTDPWIPIAQTGTWRDSGGTPRTFTQANFDAIIANYDPKREEAPLVLGHPKTDDPAYGWVRALKREGGLLFAQIAQVPAELRQAVQSGLYRYVSMALHPGGQQLRHVGLLGAVPPAIKGLGPVQLNDGDGVVTVECFAEEPTAGGNTMPPEDLQQRLGALEQQVKSLTEANAALTEKLAASEKGKGEAEAAKASAEQGKTQVEQEFAAFKGERQQADRTARLEKLTAAGKVTPGEHKDILTQVETLAKVPEAVEFSDGSKDTLEERFWKGLEARAESALLGQAFSAPDQAERSTTPGKVTKDLAGKM